jgi:hypothetical protein
MYNSIIESKGSDGVEGVSRLVITDYRILEFYRKHPDVDFVRVNLHIIDMFELQTPHTDDDASTTDMNINTRDCLAKLMADLAKSQTQTEQTATNVSSLQMNLATINQNLQTMKQDYIREITAVMTNASLSTNDKISTVLERNSSHLVDRTTVLLAENIPKQQDACRTQISALFRDLSASLLDQTSKLSAASLPDFLASVETKYSATVQDALKHMEARMSQNLNDVKAESLKAALTQDRLAASVDDFMAKYGNSSNKGKIGEANLASVLAKLYPSAECVNTTGTPNSGDFRLVRGDNKPVILLENKDYIQNIDKAEIAKFITDVDTQKMSGVFLSQSSGIAFKHNYQIDFHHGRVLVYVHNCAYCPEKIRAAIDIIDALEPKLKSINGEDNGKNSAGVEHIVSGEELDEINREYQRFVAQKEGMLITIKDNAKKLGRQIEDMQMPELGRYLQGRYAHVKSQIFTCDLCSMFHGNTKQSLAAHRRCCRAKSAATTVTATPPITDAPTTTNVLVDALPPPVRASSSEAKLPTKIKKQTKG